MTKWESICETPIQSICETPRPKTDIAQSTSGSKNPENEKLRPSSVFKNPEFEHAYFFETAVDPNLTNQHQRKGHPVLCWGYLNPEID